MKSILCLSSLALLLLAASAGASAEPRPFIFVPVDDEVAVFEWTGHGLWRTDGTAAGTFQLLPECGGDCDDLLALGAVDGKLFFLREDLRFSLPTFPKYQLWATDGSMAGTVQLTDAPTGLSGPVLPPTTYLLAPELGMLFFANTTAEAGHELWASDGTSAGTRLVTDLRPGPASSLPQPLAALDDQVLFQARDGSFDDELWITDGTAAGTRLVMDLVPGDEGSLPAVLAVSEELAFFTLHHENFSHQLWVTDGTTAGTRLIFELPPLPDNERTTG